MKKTRKNPETKEEFEEVWDNLSSTQRKVLRLFCQNKNDQEIAQLTQQYKEDNVRYHFSQIYEKFGYEKGKSERSREDLKKLCKRLKPSLFENTQKEASHLDPPVHPDSEQAKPMSDQQNISFPSGALSLDSPLYIKREPMESECYGSILSLGSVTRIMAPSKFGKTSLLNRIVDYAKRQNYRVAYVNIKQVIQESTSSSLEKFLHHFCKFMGDKLGSSLDSAWQDQRTAQINCTRYFEELLMEAETPLLLVLDGVEKLYFYDTINPEFFPMLRTWQDKVSDPNKEHWKKLRQVIAYSCQNYGNLDVSRSPFNIGRFFELEEFTEAEIFELGQGYGLEWNLDQVKQLMSLIGGHPYLVNLALYKLATHPETTLEKFLEDNPSDGIYGDYLRSLIEYLERDPNLISALNQVIETTEKPVRLDPKLQYKLYGIGVIKYQKFQIKIRCELYRQYFQEYLL